MGLSAVYDCGIVAREVEISVKVIGVFAFHDCFCTVDVNVTRFICRKYDISLAEFAETEYLPAFQNVFGIEIFRVVIEFHLYAPFLRKRFVRACCVKWRRGGGRKKIQPRLTAVFYHFCKSLSIDEGDVKRARVDFARDFFIGVGAVVV